jgi:hypothetical protein
VEAVSPKPGEPPPAWELDVSLDNQKGLDTIDGHVFIAKHAHLACGRHQAVRWDVRAPRESLQAVHVHGHETVGLCRVSR